MVKNKTENISEHIIYATYEFFLGEEGASAIEYALLAALIGSTVIGAQTALGQALLTMYQDAANTIISAMGS